ncbi:O-antigen ligase family protein [Bdellovibrio sp. HCB-162]|uniref:O-antigen ligase family protein n=1 Tax=Bdellovibrio sp. HCB-162 TaxID=3394234 RepID=UPI0039BCC149
MKTKWDFGLNLGHYILVLLVAISFCCLYKIFSLDLLINMPRAVYLRSAKLFLFLIPLLIISSVEKKFIYTLALLVTALLSVTRVSDVYQISVFNIELSTECILVAFVFLLFIRDSLIISFSGLNDPASLFYFGFILVSYFSTRINGENFNYSVFWGALVPSMLIYVFVASGISSAREIKGCFFIGLMVLIISIVYGLKDIIQMASLEDVFITRIPSLYYNPLIYAGILIFLVPFIYKLWMETRRILYPVWLLIWLTSLFEMFLTESRGALVIFIFQHILGVYLIASSYGNLRRALKITSVFVVVALVVSGIFIKTYNLDETLFRRFGHLNFSQKGNSAHERVLGWKAGWEIGSRNFLGAGPGAFKYEYKTTQASTQGNLSLESAHSFFANIFSETGIAGLLFFVLFCFYIWKYLFALKKSGRILNSTYISLAISFVGLILYYIIVLGEFQHRNSSFPFFIFIIMCALVVGIYKKELREV